MNAPIRRRLDIKTTPPAGDGENFLSLLLIDSTDGELITAQALGTLPSADTQLGETGMTVGQFLAEWRQGEPHLDEAAREYGRLLYRHLLLQPNDIGEAWRQALGQAEGRGLRLEIGFPLDSATLWHGQHVASLPFELLCDDGGYLFRRHGWSTLRRSSKFKSRKPRRAPQDICLAKVQVSWANVQHNGTTIAEEHFSAHDEAVAQLAQQGGIARLLPLPRASRRELSDALAADRPDVFIWIGHGLSAGDGLLLHNREHVRFPQDPGIVVSATDFAKEVRRGEVDIVLLWSCHGAGNYRTLDVGVAEALLNPAYGDAVAVLAAFSAIEAPVIAALSRDLIRGWVSDANADLETALAGARDCMDEAGLSWARPVLFLRTPPTSGPLRLVVTNPSLNAAAGGQRLRWLPSLPAAAARYIDSHNRLQQLTLDLERHPVVVVEGLAGIGKTEIALALAHRRRNAGEDVVFIDVSAQADLAALRQTLGLLVREAPFDSEKELLLALEGRHWTMILDNAEDLLREPAVRAELLTLLAGLRNTGIGFRAVVTSRHALASQGSAEAEGLFPLPLRLLDQIESHELLVVTAGPRLAPSQRQPEITRPLLDRLDGIARAIVLMAGQLGADADIAALCARLDEEGPLLIADPAIAGIELPEGVDTHLHKSRLVSALNLSLKSAMAQLPECAALFDTLGAFPAGLSQALLPHAEFPWLSDALGVLLDHNLVDLTGDERRIVVSAPVREYARLRLEKNGDSSTDTARLLDQTQVSLAQRATEMCGDLGTEFGASAIFGLLSEESNLLQTLTRRMREPVPSDAEILEMLFAALGMLAVFAGRISNSLAALETFGAKLERLLPDSKAAATASLHIGRMRLRSNDLEGAHDAFEAALLIYRRIGSLTGEIATQRALGDLMMRTDDLKSAEPAYRAALRISRQLDSPLSEANTLMALGNLNARSNNLADANTDYDAALQIFRQAEDRLGEANTLKSLGDLKARIDDLEGADTAYGDALQIFRMIAERLGEAGTLKALGDLRKRTDEPVDATAFFAEALRIYRQIEDRLGEANTLRSIGDLNLRGGDVAGAHTAYEDALLIYRQIGASLGEANTLKALGDLRVRKDDAKGALEAYGIALDICKNIEDPLGEANTLSALGDLNSRIGDESNASIAFDAALEIYRQIDERMGEANTLQKKGEFQAKQGDHRSGFSTALQALRLHEDIGNRLGIASCHTALARIAISSSAFEQAVGLSTRAIGIYSQIGERYGESLATCELARAMVQIHYEEGLACLLHAQDIAAAINDSNADSIQKVIDRIRPGNDAESFDAEIAALRKQASPLTERIRTEFEALVTDGKLDLYALPPPVENDDD